MNHLKIYESIIQKAKSENRIKLRKNQEGYIYYDNHHILPACLNGSDEQFNRQLLTDKEHYICHKLLTYIYKGNKKIVWAFLRMTYCKNGNYIKSSRDYAYAKELIRKILIGSHLSKETKQKIGESSKGRKHSEEAKKKCKENNIRKHEVSEETRQKQIKNNLGKNNPMYGKKQSKETIEKRKKTCEERYKINCSLNIRKINRRKNGYNDDSLE